MSMSALNAAPISKGSNLTALVAGKSSSIRRKEKISDYKCQMKKIK